MSALPHPVFRALGPAPPPATCGCGPFVLHARVVCGRGGGPEKTIFRSAAYAERAGLPLAAAYLRPVDDPAFDAVRSLAAQCQCPLFEVPERGPLDTRCVRRVLRLCRTLGVTIWHGHDYKSNLLGLVLSRRHPMHLVSTVHGWTWHTLRTRLYHHVDNWCLRRYHQVLAVSADLAAHCRRHGVDPARVRCVPNGIDSAQWRRRRRPDQARAELGVGGDRLVLGVVGRLSPEKGVDRAVRALATLRKRFAHLELHLVGDGPQARELAELAARQEVGDAVHFHGWQADTPRFFEMMDVLLLPSRTEGLPNAVLEAMALEVPVAATEVGAVRDLLDGGRAGILLGPDDSRWSTPLAALLDSPRRRRELARLARRRVEDHFSFEACMARVLGIYRKLGPAWPAPRSADARAAA